MKKFQNIRKRVGLQELKIPKILLTNEDDGIIIMENLKTKGYQLLDRVHNEGKYYCFH
jgi:aminoglycoside/choline kinase family phosphotransferase